MPFLASRLIWGDSQFWAAKPARSNLGRNVTIGGALRALPRLAHFPPGPPTTVVRFIVSVLQSNVAACTLTETSGSADHLAKVKTPTDQAPHPRPSCLRG